MEGGGNEDDASASGRVRSCVAVLGRRLQELGDRSFESVERADCVNVQNSFEGIGRETRYGREEVACCTGTTL